MESQLPIQVEGAVRSIDSAAKVILFGSRARGEAREDSDWDFLILTSREVTPDLEDEFRAKLKELIKTGLLESKYGLLSGKLPVAFVALHIEFETDNVQSFTATLSW